MTDAKDPSGVEAICERIGYGRVMQIAAELWKKKDPVGALTVGPCAGLINNNAKDPSVREWKLRGANDSWNSTILVGHKLGPHEEVLVIPKDDHLAVVAAKDAEVKAWEKDVKNRHAENQSLFRRLGYCKAQ